MKIGIIVDGQGEPDALERLFPKLDVSGNVLRPVYADLQPRATCGQIARKALDRVQILRQRGATNIILLLDREDRADCPGGLASEIERSLGQLDAPDVHVGIKNRALENWLIADPDALRRLPGRFRPTATFRKRVSPDKADAVHDAGAILNRIVIGNRYHKRHDPPRILAELDVQAAARNSRSFRRFLRLLGDRRYRGQSRHP